MSEMRYRKASDGTIGVYSGVYFKPDWAFGEWLFFACLADPYGDLEDDIYSVAHYKTAVHISSGDGKGGVLTMAKLTIEKMGKERFLETVEHCETLNDVSELDDAQEGVIHE